MQTKFHDRGRIGASTGWVHELWALFQTLDALKSTGSTHVRDFVHGALHPDPQARMSPAEMCLHPFMDEARECLLDQQQWSMQMQQLRVCTPAAKGRGPEARAVGTCSGLLRRPTPSCPICSCYRQCTCRQAVSAAALCRSQSNMQCSLLPLQGINCCPAACAACRPTHLQCTGPLPVHASVTLLQAQSCTILLCLRACPC